MLFGGLLFRVSYLEHLRKEHDRYLKLAEIEVGEAEALIAQIEASMERQVSKEATVRRRHLDDTAFSTSLALETSPRGICAA